MYSMVQWYNGTTIHNGTMVRQSEIQETKRKRLEIFQERSFYICILVILKSFEKDLCFELGLIGNKYQNQVYIFYSECVKLFWGFFIGEKGYGKYPREFRSVRIRVRANMSCCSKGKVLP